MERLFVTIESSISEGASRLLVSVLVYRVLGVWGVAFSYFLEFGHRILWLGFGGVSRVCNR